MFFRTKKRNVGAQNSHRKSLRFESLEDRRVLATMVVTNLGDGSLASLAGDGQLSLREAVEAINTGAAVDGINPVVGTFGTDDTVLFSSVLFLGSPKTIPLTAGQIELQQSVTIAGPLGGLLTIDAQQNSRIFDIGENPGTYTIAEMTLTGGMTNGVGEGGAAIRSQADNLVTIRNATLTNNVTLGNFSNGGAVSTFGSLEVFGSTISDNRTTGIGSAGGGISAQQDITITGTTLADNRTEGGFASGGGLSADGFATIVSSTVSGNWTMGAGSAAGGLLGVAGVTLTESTVSGNRTLDAAASGGGASSEGLLSITRSTIVDNHALGTSSTGGGLRTTETNIIVSGSIVANNTAGGGNADIDPGTGMLAVAHSLVGDASGLGIPAATNILNQDPLLGPLAGGGQTQTHAPLPGSPVIDMGDEFIILPPANDQRGAPFVRVADGDGLGGTVIDIGSHEVQAPANADFNGDDTVNGQDFLAWQRGFSASGAIASEGDTDDDGDVDAQDLAVWQKQYAQPMACTATTAAGEEDSLASLLAYAVAGDDDTASAPQKDTPTVEIARDQAFSAWTSATDHSAPNEADDVPNIASERLGVVDATLDEQLVDEVFWQ